MNTLLFCSMKMLWKRLIISDTFAGLRRGAARWSRPAAQGPRERGAACTIRVTHPHPHPHPSTHPPTHPPTQGPRARGAVCKVCECLCDYCVLERSRGTLSGVAFYPSIHTHTHTHTHARTHAHTHTHTHTSETRRSRLAAPHLQSRLSESLSGSPSESVPSTIRATIRGPHQGVVDGEAALAR